MGHGRTPMPAALASGFPVLIVGARAEENSALARSVAEIVGELGDILSGSVQARRSRDEITLFKSLGIAIEDLAAAHRIHLRARADGKGIAVDFGGHRVAHD